MDLEKNDPVLGENERTETPEVREPSAFEKALERIRLERNAVSDGEESDLEEGEAEPAEEELEESEEEDTDVDSEQLPPTSPSKIKRALSFLRNNVAEILIWARYMLPLLTALSLLVIGFFYNVRVSSFGKRYEISLARLLGNTITGTHNYLGGELKEATTTFYAILSVGAIVSILCYLIALFLTGLAAYTAYRAFRAGHESKESNRHKLIFKIAFPNRVCLFLSGALLLIPAAYPYFLSFVGSRALIIGGESVVFVLRNRPLIAVAILTAVTLVLAIIIPRLERRKKLNMFLLYHE